MDVDVVSTIVINRPRMEVADFAADPLNAPKWYVNIHAAEPKTSAPFDVGARITFKAQFLGKHLTYTYEIVALIPGERLVMRTAQGPFPMETSYTWATDPGGGTKMTLRNRGRPSGILSLFAPFLSFAMRRANTKDLERLKAHLEAP